MSNRASAQSSRAGSPSDSGMRKRVGKACDRCRMKKSKCDGNTPCGKCKADNSICVYGRRKRSTHDKVYPKGYVEMLEHQQTQLVLGLQELYRRSIQHDQQCEGEPLPEISREKTPLTHDLLAWLGALPQDEHHEAEKFYDDLYMMQAVAILEHPGPIKGTMSLEDRTQMRADQPQLPTIELTNTNEINSVYPLSTHVSRAPHIESAQSISKTSSSLLMPLTAAHPLQTFTGIPWDGTPAGSELTDVDTYEPWVYDTSIQATSMYPAQAEMFHQSREISIHPCLTLKDWSTTNAYQVDNSFLYT